MRTIVHLELEVEVDFDAQKAEPMTRHYPGNPAGVEINTLLINDIELDMKLFNSIMKDFQHEVEEACWVEIAEDEHGGML